MDIQKLQRAVVDALEDVKAQDIKVFNTEHLTSMFDRVVIASATSNRQTRALANSVADKSRSVGNPVIATEGEVLVNGVHIAPDIIASFSGCKDTLGSAESSIEIHKKTYFSCKNIYLSSM
jgi:ribosome-associated protein